MQRTQRSQRRPAHGPGYDGEIADIIINGALVVPVPAGERREELAEIFLRAQIAEARGELVEPTTSTKRNTRSSATEMW